MSVTPLSGDTSTVSVRFPGARVLVRAICSVARFGATPLKSKLPAVVVTVLMVASISFFVRTAIIKLPLPAAERDNTHLAQRVVRPEGGTHFAPRHNL